jgi:ABC-type sugar transport system ATPase subunit
MPLFIYLSGITENMADSYIVEMQQISKSFAGVQAVKQVSFACRKGIVHALVGENGAGKSTLMKILAGAVQADTGTIIFKGETLLHLTTRLARDKGISIIYQELALIPDMTIAENIFLGNEPRTRLNILKTRDMLERTHELLRRLGVDMNPRTPVRELTLARQQMVEIAKSLSRHADLIIMDEPSAILAGHELDQLFSIIDTLVKQGVTVIYISHRLDEVFQIAQEVTVMKDGEVVGTRPIENLERTTLVEMMVGRSLEEVFPKASRPSGEPVLVAKNLSTHRLKHASFTLHSGEILGVAGMVGSGRTELARALFGLDPLQTGIITLKGGTFSPRSPKHAIQSGLALVPEDRKEQGLFTALSIRHNITLIILNHLTRWGLIQRGEEQQTVDRAQADLNITMASSDMEVQFLSGGNQQKVVLAKWLQTRPVVIILDEPTRGIDVGAKFEIYQLMRQLNKQGVAILMISSELVEILGMSERILVMRDGRMVAELPRAEATEQMIIRLATTQHQEQAS